MLTALWNFSAAIRGYLRFYMPTNRAVDWLRSARGLKWAIPIALVATPAYLGLTALAIQLAARPGLGLLNVLVFLFFWDSLKFAWMAILSPVLWLSTRLRQRSLADIAAQPSMEVQTQPVKVARSMIHS